MINVRLDYETVRGIVVDALIDDILRHEDGGFMEQRELDAMHTVVDWYTTREEKKQAMKDARKRLKKQENK